MKIISCLCVSMLASGLFAQDSISAVKPGNPTPGASVPANPLGTIAWKAPVPQKAEFYGCRKGKAVFHKSFSEDGKLQLPVGEYYLLRLCYTIGDYDVTMFHGYYDRQTKITVAENKPLELDSAIAVVAKVNIRDRQKTEAGNPTMTFDLSVLAPNKVIATYRNLKDPKSVPGFHVLDMAGKEVFKDRFSFGLDGIPLSYNWRVPDGLKGEFIVEPVMDNAPDSIKMTIEKTKIMVAENSGLPPNPTTTAKPGNVVPPKEVVPAGPTGTVILKKVNSPEATLILFKGNKMLSKWFKNGTMALSTGEYGIASMAYTMDDCDMVVYYETPPQPKLAVAEGKTTELEPVAAATATVTASKMNANRESSLSLNLIAADGGRLSVRQSKDPKKAIHGFQVLDAAGKEVAKGSFEFG